MTTILLGRLGPVEVFDSERGIILKNQVGTPESLLAPRGWPNDAIETPGGSDVAYDLAILAEADDVALENDSVLVPFEVVLHLLEEQRPIACRWGPASPFLLTIDREGDLGVPGFRYKVGWFLGNKEIPLERGGAYLSWESRQQVFRLDATTAGMVQTMESFNAKPDHERSRNATWSSFKTVRDGAERLGVELDAALRSNSVVVPSAVGLELVEHSDGSISFAPRIPELAGPAFRTAFFNNADVPEVYSLSRPDGARVRVLMQDRHREVLRRMKRVTRRSKETALKLARAPETVFDGVMQDVDLEYGARVFGVGEIEFAPLQVDPMQGGIVGRLAPEREKSASSDVPRSDATEGTYTVDATTFDGKLVQLKLNAVDAVEAIKAIEAATTSGLTEVSINGLKLRATDSLRHQLTAAIPASALAARGYLQIYENDEVLDAADPEILSAAQASGADSPVRIPESLESGVSLRRHQLAGIQWLQRCAAIPHRTGVLLADDMGLGKTLQVLAWAAERIEQGAVNDADTSQRDGPFRPILIVAPLILLDAGTWTSEMERRFRHFGAVFRPWLVLHGPEIEKVVADKKSIDQLSRPLLDPAKLMRYRVVLSTYDTVVNYQHSLAQLVDSRPIWSAVITDEAQRYKTMRTKVSHAVKALSAPFHLASTGTPVENRLLDLWNVMDTVQPGLLGTARQFTSRYETPLTSASTSPVEVFEELRSKLLFGQQNAFLLRRGKEELTDLPKKTEVLIDCPMNPEELAHETRLVGALQRGAGRQSMHVLQEIVARSQHPVFGGGGINLEDPRALIRSSTKVSRLLTLLHEIKAKNEKVIIFARHVAIQEMLSFVTSREFNVDVPIINGSTGRGGRGSSGLYRRRLLAAFEQGAGFGAIILSPFVAGVGLTITAANHVVHYGRWWNPAVEGQATDRAYRIGQTKPVWVYFFISRAPRDVLPNGTFDEALHALICRRRALARDFLHPDADENEMASELMQVLSHDGDSKHSTRSSDLAATTVAVHRARGWVPVLFAGQGHAGVLAAMIKEKRGRLHLTPGVSTADAVASWSRLIPGVVWETTPANDSSYAVSEASVAHERAAEFRDPAGGLAILRQAM